MPGLNEQPLGRRIEGKLVLVEPKSATSHRTIALPGFVRGAVRAMPGGRAGDPPHLKGFEDPGVVELADALDPLGAGLLDAACILPAPRCYSLRVSHLES